MKNLKEHTLYLGIFFMAFSLNSCSDDDEVLPPDPDPGEITGSLTVEGEQTITQNTIVIDQIDVDNPDDVAVWLIAETEDGEILGQQEITEETQSDIMLQLDDTEADVQDGDTVTLMLYADEGDGSLDPATDEMIASETVMVHSPNVTVADQPVENNSVVIDSVTTSRAGWIVLHSANDDGTINEDDIVGTAPLTAGLNEDLTVTFDDDFAYDPGDTVYYRIYADDPADGEFTFETDPETDNPEIFGFGEDNTITDSFLLE